MCERELAFTGFGLERFPHDKRTLLTVSSFLQGTQGKGHLARTRDGRAVRGARDSAVAARAGGAATRRDGAKIPQEVSSAEDLL